MTRWRLLVVGWMVGFLGVPAFGQSSSARPPAEGRWWGLLMVGERPQRVSLELKPAPGGGWAGYIDVLRTNDRRVPLAEIDAKEDVLSFSFMLGGGPRIRFEGVIDGYVLDGNLEGEGVEGRLRAERELPRRPRVQEPVGAVPYQVKEVSIESAGVTLPATLTMPDVPAGKTVPGVVLLSAPNARGRDQDAAGHKPYLVLADRLTRAGYAVLRYDDRTMFTAGLTDVNELIGDADAAIKVLSSVPGVRAGAVGVMSHGEGTLLAMTLLARKPEAAAFAILLSAQGARGIDLKPRQISQIMVSNGLPPVFARQYLMREMAAQEAVVAGDSKAVRTAVISVLALRSGDQRDEVIDGEERFGVIADFEVPKYDSVWNRYYLSSDPAELLARVRVPVLVLQGGKDRIHDPDDNLPQIDAALKASLAPRYAIEVFPAVNHQLQSSETGASSEVVAIEETVNEDLLKRLVEWIGSMPG